MRPVNGGRSTMTRSDERPARKALPALLTTAILLFAASEGRAAFLMRFSGNSRPGSGGAAGGLFATVNFAVLDRANGAVGDTWDADPGNTIQFDTFFRPGQGSGALDTNAQYLYLYQVVNDSAMTGL